MGTRVLALISKGLFLVVGVGALVAVVGRVGAYPVSTGPGELPEARAHHIIVSSGADGVLVYTSEPSVGGSATGRLAGYKSDGSFLWHVAGIEDAVPATLPEAVVWRFRADGTGHPQATTIVRVRRDGTEQKVEEGPGELRPWYADSDQLIFTETVYDEAGLPQSKMVRLAGDRPEAITIPSGGGIQHVSASADGSRLAVITATSQGYLLTWLERTPRGAWQVVAQAQTSSSYVALSPDGQQAILGPRSPILVEFGGEEGRVLPVEYVSEARFGTSTLLVVFFRMEAGKSRTTVSVVDKATNEISWQRDFDGDLGIASDADVARLAYLRPGGRDIVVADVAKGTDMVYSVDAADDVGFRDPWHLFVALRDDRVVVLSVTSEP